MRYGMGSSSHLPWPWQVPPRFPPAAIRRAIRRRRLWTPCLGKRGYRGTLVTLAEGADVKVIADLYGRFGIKGTKDLGRNIFLVTLTEDPGPAKMEELRGENAHVKAVQPNFVYRFNGSGNPQ